jgi:hypothetical protein
LKHRRKKQREDIYTMFKKAIVFLTTAIVLSIVALAFSQDRIQTKPIPQQVPADKIQPKPQLPSTAPEQRDAKGACPKLVFVTPSPLPSTGLGWDYKWQLQASGGHAPVSFYAVVTEKGADEPSTETGVPGLKITSSGLIQGQPEKAGYYIIRVAVCDSCPSGIQYVEKKFALEVKGPAK